MAVNDKLPPFLCPAEVGHILFNTLIFKDMKKTATQIAVIATILAVFFLGGFTVGRRDTPPPATIRTDTVIVRDTIRETVPVVKYSLTTRVDTVFVKVAGDTVLVAAELPVEQKTYQTEDYKAVVEGFRPSLVSMEVYRQTRFVDRVQTLKVPDTKRWSLGPAVGYGFTVQNGRVVGVPTVGLSVQYSLIKW